MKELRTTLEGVRNINPLLGLIPRARLNPLRRDPFRANGLKRKGRGVLDWSLEGPGLVAPRLTSGCKHRVPQY